MVCIPDHVINRDAILRRIDKLEAILHDDRPKSVLETNTICRQLDDLKTGHERGLVWDESEVLRTLEMCSLLRFPEGEKAGEPVVLEPWQVECIVAPIFGWYVDATLEGGGRRRFRRVYIEMPRKNGKTCLAAVMIHKLTGFDNHFGAHVYCLAGSAKQCRTLFDDFVKGLVREGELAEFYQTWDRVVEFPETESKIELLSSKTETAHSYNPHAFVLDEVHVQANAKLWNTMVSGMGTQKSPLAVGITTAGFDRSSLCWTMREDVRQVIDPNNPAEDDSLFGIIYTIDEGDKWSDRESWYKANPNMGITVTEQFFVDQVSRATRDPEAENDFRQLNLNEWTAKSVRWISMDEWQACTDESIDEELLRSLPCWGGLDMGEHRDLSAFTLTFRDDERKRFIWKTICWAPQESVSPRADRDRSFVKNWMAKKLVRSIPGRETDTGIVARDIAELFKVYQIKQFAYDPSGAVKSVFEHLEADYGISCYDENNGMATEFYQSYRNFNPIMQEFSGMLLGGRFAHDGCEVLRWMASNLCVKRNHKGEIMPDKSESAEKIDGMVGGFMGLALAWEAEEATDQPQDYRGTLAL